MSERRSVRGLVDGVMVIPGTLRVIFFALIGLLLASSALAQDDAATDSAVQADSADALWDAYADAAAKFSQSYNETENVDPVATRGNRLYRRAVEDGEALISVLNQLLEADAPNTDDERLAVIDALLTTGQIIGSLRVEIRECDSGRIDLEKVLEHPGIETRPILKDSAQTWLDRANQCIEQLAVESARAERERQIAELERQINTAGDEAELDELRAQLAELQGMDPEQFMQVEPQGPINVAPIAVLGAGLVTLAAAGIWDLTLGDERDTIANYRDNVDATALEYDEAFDAAERIDSARTPIAVLYGIGGAATLTGAIWMAIKPRRDVQDSPEDPETTTDETVSFMPTFQRGGVGFNFRATF